MEHLTQKQIEDYYSGRRLPAAELLAVSDHLGECEACRQRIKSNDAAFFALHEAASEDGSTTHLTPEQTADYVDQNFAGEALQLVDDHLAGCEQCAFAVADLREFRNEIAPSLDRAYGPTTTPTWREKFVSLFKVAPMPALGGAALAILLLAAIAWIVWHLTRIEDDHIADVAGTEQVWTSNGWYDRFALPFAPAVHGYGHTPDDVAQVRVEADLLAGYHAETAARAIEYVEGLAPAELDRIVDERWDPPVSLGVRLVSVMNEVNAHVGQAAYLRGLVERP